MSERKSLDQRNPWVFQIHDLTRRAGEMMVIEDDLPASAGLGIEVIGVPEKADIHLSLRLESVVEGVLVSGSISAPLVGECSRCLGEVNEQGEFFLQELYYYPGRQAEEDALFIVDDMIDLDEPLRDAIVLELPFAPLCSPQCLGLCPQCGCDLNQAPEHHHTEEIDPRWQALTSLMPSQK